jgi:hypothetical protein
VHGEALGNTGWLYDRYMPRTKVFLDIGRWKGRLAGALQAAQALMEG